MFSQAYVILSIGGGGICVVSWGMHDQGQGMCDGGHAWQVGMHGGGHVWWGAYVAGGMHGRGTCVAGGVSGRTDDHCSGWYASYWNAFLLLLARLRTPKLR